MMVLGIRMVNMAGTTSLVWASMVRARAIGGPLPRCGPFARGTATSGIRVAGRGTPVRHGLGAPLRRGLWGWRAFRGLTFGSLAIRGLTFWSLAIRGLTIQDGVVCSQEREARG